jgi:hypothetical protein
MCGRFHGYDGVGRDRRANDCSHEKPQPMPGGLVGAKSNASCETIDASRWLSKCEVRAQVNFDLGEW